MDHQSSFIRAATPEHAYAAYPQQCGYHSHTDSESRASVSPETNLNFEFYIDWANVAQRFESKYAQVYSTSKKAHFDCLPPEYKIVDGARMRWCPLLLVDGMLYILHHNHTHFPKRRAFCQQQVLFDCILDELKATHRDVYNALKSRRFDETLNVARHNLSFRNEDDAGHGASPVRGSRRNRTEEDAQRLKRQEDQCFRESLELVNLFPGFTMKQSSLKWTSMRNVRNQCLEDPPTKSKAKFQVITERLNQHHAFNCGLKMKDLYAVIVSKVLLFFGSDVLSPDDIRILVEKGLLSSQRAEQARLSAAPGGFYRENTQCVERPLSRSSQLASTHTVATDRSSTPSPSLSASPFVPINREVARPVSATQVWIGPDRFSPPLVHPKPVKLMQPLFIRTSPDPELLESNGTLTVPRMSPKAITPVPMTPPAAQLSEMSAKPPSLIHPSKLVTAREFRQRVLPRNLHAEWSGNALSQWVAASHRDVFQPIGEEKFLSGPIIYTMNAWPAVENLHFDAGVFSAEPQHVEKHEGALMAEYGLNMSMADFPSPVAPAANKFAPPKKSLNHCDLSKCTSQSAPVLPSSSASDAMCLASNLDSEVDII